jgi:hypothetical protein
MSRYDKKKEYDCIEYLEKCKYEGIYPVEDEETQTDLDKENTLEELCIGSSDW